MNAPSILVISDALSNPAAAFDYLLIMGVLQVPEICANHAICGGRLRNYDLTKPYMLRCTRKGPCGKAVSLLKGSRKSSTNDCLSMVN